MNGKLIIIKRPRLLWQLAYENANRDCRAIIGPPRVTPREISEFIKACQHVSTEQRKSSLLATAIKGDPRCYSCRKPGHLSKDCSSTPRGEKVIASFPPRIVHALAKADIGQRNAALNLTKMANLFRETSGECPLQHPQPQSELSEKQSILGNAGKCTVSDLGAATRGSTGLDLVTTNKLILKEQGQVIMAPTGVWGPLPPGIVGLILGRSSITTKGIFV